MLFHSKMIYPLRALCAAATMLFGLTLDAFSQSGDTKGVHINTYIEDFNYETMSGIVTIESFVEDKIIDPDATVKPFDIVLVLDVSSSMNTGRVTYYPYTKRNSQAYTYSNYGSTYYYLYEGKYYPVSKGSYNGSYYLRFDIGTSSSHQYRYLTGTGVSTTRPTGVSSQTATIWIGVLYTRGTQVTKTRLEVMKEAAANFFDIIRDKSEDIDNRMAIVKFSRTATEVCDLLSVKDNANTIRGYITGLSWASGTGTLDGINKAAGIINRIPAADLDDRERVMIVFSDGTPNGGSTEANNVVSACKTLKVSKGVTIYSVGLLDNNTSEYAKKMMEYLSSNYPNATSTSNSGARADGDYYWNDPTGESLNEVFAMIASKLDPPTIYFDVETTVKDSFDSSIALDLPQGASSIRVYTADCTGYNSATDTYTFGTLQAYSGLVINLDSTTNGFNTGNFNYSDNWVGVTGTNNDPHGKELVLKIPFKFKPAAAHLTEDELVVNINGDTPPELELGTRKHATAENLAALPFKSLTVVKDGLHKGESAIFAIDRNPLGSETASVHVNRIVLTGTSDDGTSVSYRVPFLNPKATYIVTEHTDWSWTYTPDVTGGRTTTQTKDMRVSGTATVNFKDDKIGETKLPRNSETIVYHRQ